MAVDLAAYVRADPRDSEFVQQCTDTATGMVERRIGEIDVPEAVRDQAILEVAANLYQRRQSAAGTRSFTDPEMLGNPHRPALDPMTPAGPILQPYLGPGIA